MQWQNWANWSLPLQLHSDLDRGDGQVTYHLSGDGAMSIFTIDERTGDIHATRRLDREQQASYVLRAQVRDRISQLLLEPESQFTIRVQDINDNAPRFLDGPYAARVPERAPAGTSVVTVTATDADDPTYGTAAQIVYSLLQGGPYFTVDPNTGVVRTALPDLDRETRDRYQLVVQARDLLGRRGALSGTTAVTVTLTDVNDNPPRFPRRNYRFSIPESVPAPAVVARIKAVDPDLGQNAEVEYRVLDGDGPGTFRVLTDPNTQEGLLMLLKVLVLDPGSSSDPVLALTWFVPQGLDFEVQSSYLLRVEASNRQTDARFLLAGPFNDEVLVQVQVEDEDESPVFSESVHHLSVSEDAPVGTSVGAVSAHDPDRSNSSIRYSIDRKSDIGGFFDIDSSSGTIRTSRLLDREVRVQHNITIIAMETSDPSQAGSALVLVSVTDVNDNPPSFGAESRTLICEDVRPGQVVGILSAMDPDDPEDGHHFLFSLPAGSDANLSFSLTDNGDNTASVLALQPGLRLRDQPVHLVAVVIADSGRPSLSSTNTLTVSVCRCDRYGNQRHCSRDEPHHVAVATAAVLTGLLTFLGVAMVTAAVRSRRQEEVEDEERDAQENFACYDDEGGGEEDTKAFNMAALRHLDRPDPTGGSADLEARKPQLLKPNLDHTAPPADFLPMSWNGRGSAACSICSISSISSPGPAEPDQNFSFLMTWASRFWKLADLYEPRGVEPEEDS
ncbi:cadherin-7-like isoform X1 [Poecilia formosa]|uniref:cadherin-7-like isoform X1 n=1 Tax=Poecilia formosa TaxID=48698 RepID=UPI0007B78FEF|nr:PREDICTED: cadherin-7-like isoform X1 [Poecilia formosa]